MAGGFRKIADSDLWVENGHVFDFSYKKDAILNGGVHELLISVPANTHMIITDHDVGVGAGNIDLRFFEGPTVSATGTLLSTFNRNRAVAFTATVLFYRDPTVTDDGTELPLVWVPPSDLGSGRIVELVFDSRGFRILDGGTLGKYYLIRIENNSGVTIDVSNWITFREEAV